MFLKSDKAWDCNTPLFHIEDQEIEVFASVKLALATKNQVKVEEVDEPQEGPDNPAKYFPDVHTHDSS